MVGSPSTTFLKVYFYAPSLGTYPLTNRLNLAQPDRAFCRGPSLDLEAEPRRNSTVDADAEDIPNQLHLTLVP